MHGRAALSFGFALVVMAMSGCKPAKPPSPSGLSPVIQGEVVFDAKEVASAIYSRYARYFFADRKNWPANARSDELFKFVVERTWEYEVRRTFPDVYRIMKDANSGPVTDFLFRVALAASTDPQCNLKVDLPEYSHLIGDVFENFGAKEEAVTPEEARQFLAVAEGISNPVAKGDAILIAVSVYPNGVTSEVYTKAIALTKALSNPEDQYEIYDEIVTQLDIRKRRGKEWNWPDVRQALLSELNRVTGRFFKRQLQDMLCVYVDFGWPVDKKAVAEAYRLAPEKFRSYARSQFAPFPIAKSQ
jgi:hypothetical protein